MQALIFLISPAFYIGMMIGRGLVALVGFILRMLFYIIYWIVTGPVKWIMIAFWGVMAWTYQHYCGWFDHHYDYRNQPFPTVSAD